MISLKYKSMSPQSSIYMYNPHLKQFQSNYEILKEFFTLKTEVENRKHFTKFSPWIQNIGNLYIYGMNTCIKAVLFILTMFLVFPQNIFLKIYLKFYLFLE